MPPRVWLRYVFGQAEAIRQVAASRAALWTGIVLVLLTAIARSYDQTYLLENPLLWVFGPLLFSLVSGSWLYAVVYAWFARREVSVPGDPKPTNDGGWRSFMGLFWMTAPIAWLYAIPVERFLDSMSAARANLVLLSLVSVWRVLLMARVIQVATKAPLVHALIWVAFAASLEVLVVFFFGGGFANAMMRGMGGMRNSPEEDILYGAMSTAFLGALWIAPISLVLALAWRPKTLLQPLPIPVDERICWSALGVACCFWVGIAILPQRELARTVKVERLLGAGRAREALDVLASHQPGDFAPARTLPPKPFERSLFTELPECFEAIQSSDPQWVRDLMMSRLEVMVSHGGPFARHGIDRTLPREKQVDLAVDGFRWHGPDADGLLKLFGGLQRLPEGEAWVNTNGVFIEAAWRLVTQEELRNSRLSRSAQPQTWPALSNLLSDRFLTNSFALSNRPPSVSRPSADP